MVARSWLRIHLNESCVRERSIYSHTFLPTSWLTSSLNNPLLGDGPVTFAEKTCVLGHFFRICHLWYPDATYDFCSKVSDLFLKKGVSNRISLSPLSLFTQNQATNQCLSLLLKGFECFPNTPHCILLGWYLFWMLVPFGNIESKPETHHHKVSFISHNHPVFIR